MKSLRSIPALGAFFVLVALVVSACGSGIPGNSVAVVAGNPITTQAFDHWIWVAAKQQAASGAPGQPVIAPNDPPNFSKCIAEARALIPAVKRSTNLALRADCKRLFTSLSSQVMEFLITSYWFQADAHKLHIKITPAQVQKALATAKQGQFPTAAQFQAFLTSTGQTLPDVTYRIKIQQIYLKLLARHPTTVSNAQVAAYYNSHKSSFVTPQSRNLKIVLTKTPGQAAAAKAALKSGSSWSTVAKKYSIDPTTKNNGGVLTGVTQSQQDAALTQAAFNAPVNRLVGPVKGQFGYYLVEVTKITPAVTKSLAAATPLIMQTLTSQLQTAAQTAVTNQAKKDWLSQTKCRSLYAMADCSGYKPPKATASPGAAPSSSG